MCIHVLFLLKNNMVNIFSLSLSYPYRPTLISKSLVKNIENKIEKSKKKFFFVAI